MQLFFAFHCALVEFVLAFIVAVLQIFTLVIIIKIS